MPKRIIPLTGWISAHVASQLLSDKMGRPIPARYVVKLSRRKKNPVRTQEMSNRLLYNREDLEQVTIKKKSTR